MPDLAGRLGKEIVILEKPGDIRVFLEHAGTVSRNHLLIAVTPDVCWDLDKRGLSYTRMDRYYDPAAIYHQGMENYSGVTDLCSSLDSLFRKNNPLMEKYGLRPARDNFYFIKQLLDNLTLRVLIIEEIIQKEQPLRILFFAPGTPGGSVRGDFPFGYEERLFALLFKTGSWTIPVSALTCPGDERRPVKTSSGTSALTNFSKTLKHYPIVFVPAFTAKNFGLLTALTVKLCQIRNRFRSGNTLYLLREDPSWGSIMPEMYQAGFQVQ